MNAYASTISFIRRKPITYLVNKSSVMITIYGTMSRAHVCTGSGWADWFTNHFLYSSCSPVFSDVRKQQVIKYRLSYISSLNTAPTHFTDLPLQRCTFTQTTNAVKHFPSDCHWTNALFFTDHHCTITHKETKWILLLPIFFSHCFNKINNILSEQRS